MGTNVAVYDRDGRVYYMTADEAAIAVKSGAYRTEARLPQAMKSAQAPLSVAGSTTLGILEKKTGKVFHLAPIDAREAVKTGFFEFAKTPSPAKQETLEKAVETHKTDEPTAHAPTYAHDDSGTVDLENLPAADVENPDDVPLPSRGKKKT